MSGLGSLDTLRHFFYIRRQSRFGTSREADADLPAAEPEDVCYLQFSSGSTRAPTGVAVTHRALLANAHRDMDRFTELAPEDLASKQTVDTQKALIAQLTAQLKGDDAAIDNARTQLDYTRIASPIDGRTGMRLVAGAA